MNSAEGQMADRAGGDADRGKARATGSRARAGVPCSYLEVAWRLAGAVCGLVLGLAVPPNDAAPVRDLGSSGGVPGRDDAVDAMATARPAPPLTPAAGAVESDPDVTDDVPGVTSENVPDTCVDRQASGRVNSALLRAFVPLFPAQLLLDAPPHGPPLA